MYPSSEWRLESYVIIFWPFFLSLFSKFWSSSFSSSSSFIACWVIVTSQESQVWHIATRAALRPKAAKGQCQQNVFRADPLTNAEHRPLWNLNLRILEYHGNILRIFRICTNVLAAQTIQWLFNVSNNDYVM